MIELPNVDAHYTLNVQTFDPSAGSLEVTERVDIQSREGHIETLHFTVVAAEYGYFTLRSIQVNQVPVSPTVLNHGFTFALALPPDDQWEVEIDFALQLAQIPSDWYGLGLDGDVVQLGYWFPIISDRHGFPSTADPAYTRTASFDVSIPVPQHYLVVSTGEEIGREVLPDGRVRYDLYADRVRDFALVIAPGYRVDAVTSNTGIRVELYSPIETDPALRSKAINSAVYALDQFSELIGPYPYPVFRIAHVGRSLPGGIEFPKLVFINLHVTPLERLVYHETAHQWLYGIIGTRPQIDPWIDEGGAQFLDGGLSTGFRNAPSPPPGGYQYPLDAADAELPGGGGIPGYRSIYVQGHAFYQTVLETMGPDQFWAAMQDLYARHAFGIVTPWDVLFTWQCHSSSDLRPLFSETFRYPWIGQLPQNGGC